MASSFEALMQTVEASLSRMGIDAARVASAPGATLAPPNEPQFQVSPLGESTPLELHGVLGEGGMGVVHLATQRTLGRAVAVKRVRPEVRSERATLDLLREAWVTGAVEHPNVVPVHDIVRDESGAPLVILKKIEGQTWAQLMRDEAQVRSVFGASDLLEWNLRILTRVCEAVAYAHSRGILHRDLKPDNVMVGEHGETYVLDWGIAVTLDDGPRGPIPRARDANELAGTPAYMAPEMLGGRGHQLGPATDVYLLGAILFELLTGHPPHQGPTLMAIVAAIAGPPPRLPESTPEVLARLVERALTPDPAARLESARDLAVGIENYLRHRDAASLARRAEERLEQLEALIEESQSQPPAGDSAYALFSECRFGFRHALEVWPDSEVAQAGLERAIERMISFELTQGQPETATRLLAEHPSPPSRLRDLVGDALRTKTEDDKRRRALEDAFDPRTGGRLRFGIVALLGIAWVFQPLVTGIADHQGWSTVTHESLIWRNLVQGACLLAVAMYFGRAFFSSAVNRALLTGALGTAAAQIALHAADAHLGVPVAVTMRHQFLVWATVVTMIAASVDRVFAAPAFVYASGFVILVYQPTIGFYLVGLGNFILIVTVLVWTARARQRRRAG